MVLALGLVLLAAAAASAGALADPEKDLDRLPRLEIFQPGEPSLLLGSRDEPIAALAPEYRISVPLSRIPKLLQQAVLDVEDARFYEHGAISLKGMARAAIRNLSAARLKEGGSTITQQLAKSLFLSPERTLARKVKEIQLAHEIEKRYTKDKILEMYLNAIYFGAGAYGIEAAARTYFGKSVGELGLPEAALLAGLPKAPSAYSPLTDPKRAAARRNVVLARMQAEGHITAAQAQAAARQPVALAPLFRARGEAPHFVDHMRQELEARYGKALVARGGLRFHTTLDLQLQRAATEVLRAGVRTIERTRAARAKAPAQDGAGLDGALVALDPATGAILAMVGGVDHAKSQFNRAVQARRQPGSAFKPFVYAAAFEQGLSPTDILDDYPISYSVPTATGHVEWTPGNFDHQFRGPVTLRHALEESINVPTVRLLERIGLDPVISVARRLGITGDLRRELGLALGVSEVSLLELTSAYGVLANRGIRVPPTSLRRVSGPSGEVLEEPWRLGQPALAPEVAYLVTSLLQGAVERGTARRAKVAGWAVAAKTGTTQDAVDMWLVGYTPRLAAGLWIGFDQPRSVGSHETAGRLAAPIWADFMRRALTGQTPEPPPIPEGLMPLLVNIRTGLPTEPGDPEAIQEFVIRGAAPLSPLATPPLEAMVPETPVPLPATLEVPPPTLLLPPLAPVSVRAPLQSSPPSLGPAQGPEPGEGLGRVPAAAPTPLGPPPAPPSPVPSAPSPSLPGGR
ncbi:MAG: penicillin-binding protein 1A [Candidatus Methylomirabilales bacterium]